jgi:ABC-type multidrug transport system fused ATPase/permease subunit
VADQVSAVLVKLWETFVSEDATLVEVNPLVKTSDGSIITASQMLERFLFPPNQQYAPINKLSGGEKQRLSIARALLRKPKLLLFDEATSALDSLTEEEITSTIRDVSKAGTQITILIAHRLSTIMHADRIYVLEKGEIVETGKHEELLADKGLYYAMWRQQIGERKKTE